MRYARSISPLHAAARRSEERGSSRSLHPAPFLRLNSNWVRSNESYYVTTLTSALNHITSVVPGCFLLCMPLKEYNRNLSPVNRKLFFLYIANVSLYTTLELTFSASQPRWRISWLVPIPFLAAWLSSDITLFMMLLVADCMDSNQAWAELESEHLNTTVCLASGEWSSKCLRNGQTRNTAHHYTCQLSTHLLRVYYEHCFTPESSIP